MDSCDGSVLSALLCSSPWWLASGLETIVPLLHKDSSFDSACLYPDLVCDVSATTQSLNGSNTDSKISAKGSHTATIDFVGFNNGTCTNNYVAVLSELEARNPIMGTLEIFIDKTNNPSFSSGNKLAWNTEIDGKSYRILLYQFPTLLVSESDTDTNIQASNGSVAIIVTQKGKRVLGQGTECTDVVDVNFSVTK